MIHRVDDKNPDFELIIKNLVENLQRSGRVVCGVCKRPTSVWSAVMSRGYIYHCEECVASEELISKFRKDPRWPLSIPFSCRVDGETLFGFTLDLSPGGLGLGHPRVCPDPGQALRFTLIADRRIRFDTVVRYVTECDEGHRIGVSFEGTGPENRIKVDQLLSYFDQQLR